MEQKIKELEQRRMLMEQNDDQERLWRIGRLELRILEDLTFRTWSLFIWNCGLTVLVFLLLRNR